MSQTAVSLTKMERKFLRILLQSMVDSKTAPSMDKELAFGILVKLNKNRE